jgi:thrombospondin type 3 repeat protein
MTRRIPIISSALLVLSLLLLLTSCSGGGGSDPAASTSTMFSDADSDGLSTALETLYGTSDQLADTDGDGISDDREVRELGFDPEVNPVKFNPLVADFPRIGIILRSAPNVRVFLTDEFAVTKTIEVDRTKEVTVDVIENVTETITEETSVTQDVAQDTTFSNGVAGDITITNSISKAMSESVELDFTKEQSVENRVALTEIEAFEVDHIISASGGLLEFTVEVQNRGNIAFQVVTLVLSVSIPDPSNPGKLIPICNLVPETIDPFYDPYPPYVLPPGARFPTINYVNKTLDLVTVKQLLRDARSLIITVAGLELLDVDGVPFAFKFQDIEARTAQIVIDYAGIRNPERYLVATNADPLTPGVTVGRALRDILRIPFEAGPIDYGGAQRSGLVDLRGDPNVRADKGKNSFWLLVQTRGKGLNKKIFRFNFLEKDYDFENILLRGGDTFFLIYMEDKDGDGIFSRQERLLGTSDLSVDSDGDGLSDADERNIFHTDPGNPDTDGDGVIDSLDSAPLDPKVQ